MVTRFGMSRLGRVSYPEQRTAAFLPGAAEGDSQHSEETAREIDLEVRKIVADATEEVRSILVDRRNALEAVARMLMEREVIDGRELKELIGANASAIKIVPGSGAVVARPGLEAETGIMPESKPQSPSSGELVVRRQWPAFGTSDLLTKGCRNDQSQCFVFCPLIPARYRRGPHPLQ